MDPKQDHKPLASDEQPERTQDARASLQDVVDGLAGDSDDLVGDPEGMAARLRQRIEEAGLPEQPAPWVRVTADELADGRLVVMSSETRPPDEVLEDRETTAGEHKSPKLFP